MHEVKKIGHRWAVIRNNIIFPEDGGAIVKWCESAEEAAIMCEKMNRRRGRQ